MPGDNAAAAIVNTLESLGVRLIFGLPGSQTCPLYDALYSSRIRHVLVRHEQAAAYMADAYAKFTGEAGVCDGTGGPGATNLLTGIATAWTDSTPVLAFTGQQSLKHLGKGAFQELDHVALFSPITKWSKSLVRADRASEIVREAYKIATWGKPGPVHIDVPVDVQTQVLSHEALERLEEQSTLRPAPKPSGEPASIKVAATLLAHSSRPLIIAGGGVHYSGEGAWKQLKALAEYLQLPVVTTFNGRGSFPEDHPLSAGRMGVHAPAYTDEMLSEADVILAMGCRFAALSTRWWSNVNTGAALIHVDIDPEVIGRNYQVKVSIIGDAAMVLESLLDETKTFQEAGTKRRKDWLSLLCQARESWERSEWFLRAHDEESIKPQRACLEIRRCLGRDTVFTMDAGNNKLWASTFLRIHEPRTWIQSGSFGPMGYALPAAIACKLAKPERTVVAICGDGGFYMSLHELATAVQERAPVIVCVFNDKALGTIKHRQRRFYGGRLISVELENPSFAKVAEAFGCVGVEIERPRQLQAALKESAEAVKNGQPAVVDIRIDGEEQLPP
ncbi:MAG: thiamine pyrophosphate-binding protein [Candidatus Bathyarchaeota archaeon]|nr:thiamine pyrophosphate-binding protein [Candidatus Bathyarchaeota archaeon]MDH5687665.1 thiamine pyrophosphate-binding protein [Candidatus Bathyarchaeota archaeon]